MSTVFKKIPGLIMIEQTLFALPFAFIGVLFAGGGTVATWILVAVALIAARTAGMSFNRVIDAEIDAKNPRTQNRHIPRGEIKPFHVWVTAVLSSAVLIIASFLLNRLCFYLSFPAVAMLFTYSYFKRFSSSSHFYLGFIEAAAPIGGYIAVTGRFDIVPFLLGLVIMMWITGLDIVYSIQDKEFDKKENLHSLPVRIGKKKALVVSSFCYLVSITAMTGAGIITGKHVFYWIAISVIALIFLYQQKLARSENVVAAIKIFFKVNAYISPILFLGTFVDVFLG